MRDAPKGASDRCNFVAPERELAASFGNGSGDKLGFGYRPAGVMGFHDFLVISEPEALRPRPSFSKASGHRKHDCKKFLSRTFDLAQGSRFCLVSLRDTIGEGENGMPTVDIGKFQQERGLETRLKVFEWYAENPCGTQAQAMQALSLSKATVGKHVAAIRAGWRPVGAK